MTPRDRQALERIIECAQAIDAYVSRAGADWPADDMAVDAIAKRIEEIGEVAKRLTPETLATMPGVSCTKKSMSRSSRASFETIFLVFELRSAGRWPARNLRSGLDADLSALVRTRADVELVDLVRLHEGD